MTSTEKDSALPPARPSSVTMRDARPRSPRTHSTACCSHGREEPFDGGTAWLEWLPSAVREPAASVLRHGRRIAQEHMRLELLAPDPVAGRLDPLAVSIEPTASRHGHGHHRAAEANAASRFSTLVSEIKFDPRF